MRFTKGQCLTGRGEGEGGLRRIVLEECLEGGREGLKGGAGRREEGLEGGKDGLKGGREDRKGGMRGPEGGSGA